MQPAALVWGHQLRIWSTHNGEGSFFNQLVKQSNAPLAQGIYQLEHAQFGTFGIFLVPVGRDQQGIEYEALFNRIGL